MISGAKSSLFFYRMANHSCLMSPRMVMTTVMGSLTSNSPCQICQARCTTINVKHIHLSSIHYNKQMARMGENNPVCHFCDISHPIDNDTRQKVILTTATLSGIQFANGWAWAEKPSVHCDVEAIPDGKIVNLKRAWERSYLTNPLPIDTVLVAGLEDVLELSRMYHGKYKEAELAEIISEVVLHAIENLHNVIRAHSERYTTDDTLAVCTMVHVPAMYWKDSDGEYPTEDYTNLREVIDRTNLKIEAFNLKNGRGNAPKLHQAGERGKSTKRVYMWDSFVEKKKEDMMNLKDPQRLKMARLITKYFEKGTPSSIKITI